MKMNGNPAPENNFGEESSHRWRKNILKRIIQKRFTAGMSVEAALLIPLFLFFMVNILFLFDVIRLQLCMQAALHQTGKEMGEYAYYYEYALPEVAEFLGQGSGDAAGKAAESGARSEAGGESDDAGGHGGSGMSGRQSGISEAAASLFLSETYVRSETADRLKQMMDADQDEASWGCLEGGAPAISYLRSEIMEGNDLICLKADYRAQPILKLPGTPELTLSTEYYGHAWTGYTGEEGEATAGATVYVTASGTVYHKDRDCTYLKPSVQCVSSGALSSLRSRDGSKYYPCESCRPGRQGSVYITPDGNRYHATSNCRSLRRTVREVPLEEISEHMRACSKCGGEN